MSGLVMLFLFASEIRDYLQPAMKEELFVDTSRTGKLKINVDIVFSHISCDFLGIDAMDVSGEQHIDIEHNVYKRRLDMNGKPIEDAQKEHHLGAIAKVTNTTNNSDQKGILIFLSYVKFLNNAPRLLLLNTDCVQQTIKVPKRIFIYFNDLRSIY